MIDKKIIILFLLILILALGCGRKGDPVPWSSVVPKRIVDLRAIPREGRLLLEWTAPKENTDGSPLTDLAEFKLMRSEGELTGEECRNCLSDPSAVFEMKVDKSDEMGGKKVSLLVEDLEARKVYAYQVISINRRGYPGTPSNSAEVYWDFPPQQPGGVRVERGDQRIDLSWEPVLGATGYNVYRHTEGEPIPLTPLNREPLKGTGYTDLSVKNETRYYYSARAVRRVIKTDVEGPGSLEVQVTPTDLIPPVAPEGLAAIPLKEGIELNWEKSREPDLLGYQVYRRKVGERDYQRLDPVPLAKETYLDRNVELNQEYDYAVTTLDNSVHRNESPPSEEVRVKYIH